MITREYQRTYRAEFNKILREAPRGSFDESALPSYVHKNRLISWLFWKRIETALSLADDVKGQSVLDFGCGGGVTFKWLHERKYEITACEDRFVELTKTVVARLNIPITLWTNIYRLDKKKFDLIFALDVLEHVADLDALIDQFLELSHGQTKIIVSGPTESFLYRVGRHLIGYADQGRFHARTIYDIERVFRDKGLKNVVTRNLYFPFTLFRVSVWTKKTMPSH